MQHMYTTFGQWLGLHPWTSTLYIISWQEYHTLSLNALQQWQNVLYWLRHGSNRELHNCADYFIIRYMLRSTSESVMIHTLFGPTLPFDLIMAVDSDRGLYMRWISASHYGYTIYINWYISHVSMILYSINNKLSCDLVVNQRSNLIIWVDSNWFKSWLKWHI